MDYANQPAKPQEYLPPQNIGVQGIPFIVTLRDGTDLLITVFSEDPDAEIQVARRFDHTRWSAPMDSVRRAP